MKLYATTYREGKYKFASYIYARSRKSALKILKKRGLGEIIEGKKDSSVEGDSTYRCEASHYYSLKMFNDLFHWLCFAGNVLCNARLLKRNDLLGDRGLMHMASHQMMRLSPNYQYPDHKYHLEEDEILIERLKEFDRLTEKLGY